MNDGPAKALSHRVRAAPIAMRSQAGVDVAANRETSSMTAPVSTVSDTTHDRLRIGFS
ncbi:hypothetical protein [Novosphingobium aquae]|uniref:Uncharacterized protein n=1 Tax=Novosphingobium aquae TaxID=3133435 RepID=A0ABU8SA37_9SPHN